MPLPGSQDGIIQPPNLQPEPLGLQKIAPLTSVPPQRPLDPFGIDVYGELPIMQRAYEMAGRGKLTREAGYYLFPTDYRYAHSAMHISPANHTSITAPKNALAVVHTHAQDRDPKPSLQDRESPFPNYVFSGDKLYVTDPATQGYYEYKIGDWNVKGLGKIVPKQGRYDL